MFISSEKVVRAVSGHQPARLEKLTWHHFEYPVLLKADGDGFVVTCRDLPALITQGDDEADALREAADAMDEVFAAYMK